MAHLSPGGDGGLDDLGAEDGLPGRVLPSSARAGARCRIRAAATSAASRDCRIVFNSFQGEGGGTPWAYKGGAIRVGGSVG